MAYIEFKPLVKKVNLKPDGVQEVVLEVRGGGLAGKIDTLADMIDTHVNVQLEEEFVSYSVVVNKETQKPMTEYKVDDQGVVHEVKPIEQTELDLGLPPELIPTEQKEEVLKRETIDAFIASGLAPTFDDMNLDFYKIMGMHLDGLSYLKIASKLNISDGRLMEDLDEYRKRVAPLAEKWGEWKESQKKVKLDREKNNGNDDEGTGVA
ncbi:2-methylcitrate dehydratase [Sporolactobacillus pectinivorans]|uniref:2-methylcitrate dehydratase n=1 Tax=Sporolactobacillus pectinivorans TaxID=1591408 RepID=UPI000C2676F5|nr:2-methylcitrate dehydratase [Sporolactobacillus pectinivorans]